MKYQIKQIEDFAVVISDEEIKEGWKGFAYKEDVKGKVFNHFYTTNTWYNDAKKVIATIGKQIEGLPILELPQEEDIEKLAEQLGFYDSTEDNKGNRTTKAFIAGYNAAQNKKWSDDDMNYIIDLISGTYNITLGVLKARLYVQKKQFPTAVELGVEVVPDYNNYGSGEIFHGNRKEELKVIKWYYE